MKKISFTVLIAFMALSLAAQMKVSSPDLVSPENEDVNQMPNVLLDWDAVSGIGPITYEVQIDSDESFSNPEIFFTVDETSQRMENLFFGQNYYWRVRATDNNGTGDWSDEFIFTLFDQLVPKDPGDEDDEILPDEELKWKNQVGSGNNKVDVEGVTFFEYQVSFDDAFTDIYINSSISAEFFVVNCAELYFDTTYYWRVRAVHDLDQSEWSEIWSFLTIVVTELDEPDNEDTEQMVDATLVWDEISGAFEYKYQVCIDPNFINPCTDASVSTNEVTLTPLMFGETYHWRVKALHTKDTTIWTEPWSFETINTVFLDTPEEGDTVTLFPTLTWEEQTGIEKFELNYGKDTINPEIHYIDFPETSFLISSSLEEKMEYYWRVRAIRDGDTSGWSGSASATWRKFYTPFPPSGIHNDFLQKRNLQIFPNPSNGFLSIELYPTEKSIVHVSVMDLLGQRVFDNRLSFDMGEQIRRIDLSNLENGLYILKLESGNNIYNQKFILDK